MNQIQMFQKRKSTIRTTVVVVVVLVEIGYKCIIKQADKQVGI